jgi:hypothetical protein
MILGNTQLMRETANTLGTVLRTVLTDFKNKHELDIYDLRNDLILP